MIALLQLSCTVDEREEPQRNELLEELKQKAQSPFNQFLSPPFHVLHRSSSRAIQKTGGVR